MSSEQDEFSCRSDGVRIYKKEHVIVAPPFKSELEYIYGTFQRTSDGSLIMKYSKDQALFMWGFIPWFSHFSSYWVKWPAYINGEAKGAMPNAGSGDVESMYNSYLTMSRNYQNPLDAWKWLCRVADLGYAKAQAEVAYWHHSNAWRHVKPKRLSWLEKAGVQQNNKIAYLWYSLAANGRIHELQTRDKLFSGVFSNEEISEAKEMITNWAPGQCEHDLLSENASK